VKHRLQFNPTMGIALVCALLWFALWLVPFHPAPLHENRPPARPSTAFRPDGVKTFRRLRSPALFALPSEQGFSGDFPKDRINLFVPANGTNNVDNTLPETRISSSTQPDNQPFYLPRSPVERAEPDQISLQEPMPQPKMDLPAPGAHPTAIILQPDRIALFLSPELLARVDAPPQLTVPGILPTSVRIHLGIRPDGTVDQVLFETPVENEALAGTVRQLRFKPAAVRTDSWLDLRFTPEGDS